MVENLGDIPIPDFSGVEDDPRTEWVDGWYEGNILDKREFTDSTGSDRVFESTDIPSRGGDSRNINLQVTLKRKSDGRTMNNKASVNYRPDDLTQETIAAVMADTERVKAGEKRVAFRQFMVLNRLSKLQKIAGIRQFQRNGNGGLDLTPLHGKLAYFRIGPDDQEGRTQYKKIIEFQAAQPKKVL